MKRQIVILPAAEDNLDIRAQFYETQEPGLEDYFLATLKFELQALAVHGSHRKQYGYHRLVSKRFPYAAFYRVAGDTIFIHAVFDCSRDPAEIRRRLRGG